MKKIILLEDKIERDNLKQCTIDFDNYKNIETFIGKSACVKLNDFIKNNESLNAFDTILIHASIKCNETNIIGKLKTYCSINSKNLVIFSGGGDIGSLQDNTLEITAKNLYENIEVFLDNYPDTSHLLMLAYSERWTLNIFLNLLEKLNKFIENNTNDYMEDFDEFEDDFDLLRIKVILNSNEYEDILKDINIKDDEITISQMKILSNNLKNLIKSKANE